MSEVAFADGFSQVECTDGIRGSVCNPDPLFWHWDAGSVQTTDATSNNKVRVEGRRVAVEGDAMIPHPDGVPCVPSPVNHAPTTSLAAGKLRIGGKHVLRVGSKFNDATPFDHTISTGSAKVRIGGPSIAV